MWSPYINHLQVFLGNSWKRGSHFWDLMTDDLCISPVIWESAHLSGRGHLHCLKSTVPLENHMSAKFNHHLLLLPLSKKQGTIFTITLDFSTDSPLEVSTAIELLRQNYSRCSKFWHWVLYKKTFTHVQREYLQLLKQCCTLKLLYKNLRIYSRESTDRSDLPLTLPRLAAKSWWVGHLSSSYMPSFCKTICCHD